MNVLFLTKYDQAGASSQVRIYQFIPYFEERNIHCSVKPFLTRQANDMLSALGKEKRYKEKFGAYLAVLRACIKRIADVLSALSYDVVVVQETVLPFGLQWLLRMCNSSVIYEFDDTIWYLSEDQKRKSFIKRLYYKNDVRLFYKMVKKSKIIIAENSYLANYAKKFNHRVVTISAPINTKKFTPSAKQANNEIVLGWIGSFGTTYLLESLSEILNTIGRRHPNAILHNIGGYPIALANMRVQNIPWDNDTLMAELAKLDIGLMPLDDDDFNKGRLGYKMIIYFSIGIPTVAQDRGLNREVIGNGINGYLAETPEQWVQALEKLIGSKEERDRLGSAARLLAEQKFEITNFTKQYIKLFYELAPHAKP